MTLSLPQDPSGQDPSQDPGPRIAVCLHGFLRTGASMMVLAQWLKRRGYSQVKCPTFNYAVGGFDKHAARAAALIDGLSQTHGQRVDVISHSMGGLLLRGALAHGAPVRRAVMLAPPNQGAQAAELMRSLLPTWKLGWDPLQPLLPGAPAKLPSTPAGVEIGVITGGNGGRGYNPLLSGDNDGKVRIDEARLDGMTDFRVVPVRHPVIMWHPRALTLIARFLDNGSFEGRG